MKIKPSSLNLHKELVFDIGKKLNVHKLEDWNKITNTEFIQNGGGNLVKHYGGIVNTLKAVYPEKKWNVFNRNQVPRHYWDERENRREFIENFEKNKGIKELKDWENIKKADFIEFEGTTLLRKYHNNIHKLLESNFLERNWEFFRFGRRLSFRLLNDVSKQRKYIETFIIPKLQINKFDDWYLVSVLQFKKSAPSARTLLRIYSDSLYLLLEKVFPEHEWDILKTPKVHKTLFWESHNNIYRFLLHLKQKYMIQKQEDWYRISLKQLHDERGLSLIFHYNRILSKSINSSISGDPNDYEERTSYGDSFFMKRKTSLSSVLISYFSDVNWNFNEFNRQMKKSKQRWLYITLCKIFNQFDIHEEFILFPNLDVKENRIRIGTFDIYIPSLQIAVEYNGEQHYQDIASLFAPIELRQKQDEEKSIFSSLHNIDLVIIPYWWDSTPTSLVATLLESRSYLQPFINKSFVSEVQN